MVQVGKLPRRERLVLAELSGLAGRLAVGRDRGVDDDQAVAAIHAVTTDPRLLGIAAGAAMADPTGVHGPTVELLRAAGADMKVAGEHGAEVRTRMKRQGIQYD